MIIDGQMMGITMCYAENCTNIATKCCNVNFFFQQYGCDRLICEMHKSKKNIGGKNYRPDVCINCEKAAYKCNVLMIVIPCVLFLLIAAACILTETL